MPVLTPDLLWFVADEILQCICTALAAESECPCPCRSYVSVGQPAFDDCCEGQLVVWIERVFWQDIFPNQTTQAAICAGQLAADIAVQYLTCAPMIKDDGSAPSGPELSESARRVGQSWYIANKAIACCLSQARKHRLYVIKDSRPVPPSGGCVGWQTTLTIQLPDPQIA